MTSSPERPRWQPPAGYATGLRGVCLKFEHGAAYFRVRTQLPNGKRLSRMFSIDKYGEPEALRLAKAERQQQRAVRIAYIAEHPSPPRTAAKKPPLPVPTDDTRCVTNAHGGKADAVRAAQATNKNKPGNQWYHPPEMYGIYRVQAKHARDDEGLGTWRVQIKRSGEWVCCRSFFDGDYEDRQAALAAAQAYRDEMAQTFKPLLKVVQNQRLRRNNTSGVAGVCRVWIGKYECYIAQTELPGRKNLRQVFSISKYGEDRAYALAIAERKRQLKYMAGYAQRNPGALSPRDRPSHKKAQ
jgi:hypothetical protein